MAHSPACVGCGGGQRTNNADQVARRRLWRRWQRYEDSGGSKGKESIRLVWDEAAAHIGECNECLYAWAVPCTLYDALVAQGYIKPSRYDIGPMSLSSGELVYVGSGLRSVD